MSKSNNNNNNIPRIFRVFPVNCKREVQIDNLFLKTNFNMVHFNGEVDKKLKSDLFKDNKIDFMVIVYLWSALINTYYKFILEFSDILDYSKPEDQLYFLNNGGYIYKVVPLINGLFNIFFDFIVSFEAIYIYIEKNRPDVYLLLSSDENTGFSYCMYFLYLLYGNIGSFVVEHHKSDIINFDDAFKFNLREDFFNSEMRDRYSFGYFEECESLYTGYVYKTSLHLISMFDLIHHVSISVRSDCLCLLSDNGLFFNYKNNLFYIFGGLPAIFVPFIKKK